jgi:hypothetical protein
MSLAEMRREARRRGNPNAVPSFGAASVSVPGTVDGWFALHERFGRTPMADCWRRDPLRPRRRADPADDRDVLGEQPATAGGRIRGRDGCKKSRTRGAHISARRTAHHMRQMPDGHGLFRNPELANTLELIATATDAMRIIAAPSRARSTPTCAASAAGCVMTISRVTRANGSIRSARRIASVEVCELPPNSQGVVALQTLAHPGSLQSARDGLSLRRLAPHADRSHAPRLRRSRAILRRSGFHRLRYAPPADGRIHRATPRHDLARSRHAAAAARGAAHRWRHDLPHHRRQRRHDGVFHSIELSRHGLRP